MDAALFSLLGVVLGGFLQFFFSRHLESQRAHREARTKAYTDYLRCVSDHANLDRTKVPDRELGARTADGKCRICLYGSPEVVAAFAQFERMGATMNSPEQRATFTRMVAVMRRDSTSSANVAANDLQAVLLGVDR